MHRILVAVDGSDPSWRAVDLAGELAGALNAHLTVCHIHMHGRPLAELERMARIEHLVDDVAAGLPDLPPVPRMATMAELMETARKHVTEEIIVTRIGDLIVEQAAERARQKGAREVDSWTGEGDYADGILEAAEKTGSDMIVIGKRGLGRLREMLLGSVSNKVVQLAPCTVVTVK
ncbi:Nucleotide-binding universal stress protein, UspA family [Meinhardsimonia xiamenensis]|jgi:nucleotide-binding universal stress UspA family protein|uniref:Nucleotide-binding universal stress protein, UspA family n=1 Tax=Meinhardsimonia xiamenensis TaxID=990712 RepID=A0A1G8YGR0_9RHOB|nr:universal stress protein [Meinhardsimonia xiamenensis]PRX37274.1 nucleotide-binding universal stress UspA family protein [Meinhardsimonia xiamenensis]SDK01260.1 Nucleotide-binding universal stress protein, UspA family [Meinhardsimonia xiamenensis]